MLFRRRRESTHRRLAREGGLSLEPESRYETGPRPLLREVGIHGVPRLREWDSSTVVDAPGLEGDSTAFVVLPDGTLLVEEGPEAASLGDLADAVESELAPPYRAHAVRHEGSRWAVGARSLEVAELEALDGEELILSVRDGERELVVDGRPSPGSLPALERLGEGHDAYVVQVKRLDGDLWETRVTPL